MGGWMGGWMDGWMGGWMDGWMESALIFKLDSIPNSIYYLLALSKSLNLIFLTCQIAIMISFCYHSVIVIGNRARA